MISRIGQAFRDGRGPALWGLAILVGICAGYATLGLRLGIGWVEQFAFGATEERLASTAADLPAWRLVLIPFMTGIIIAIMLGLGRRFGLSPDGRGLGVADVLEARAVKAGRIDLRSGLYSALMSAVSLGGGASAGREGPAVHLGATLAAFIGSRIGMAARGSRIMLACGAAAAVSASFNAPVAGALFAFEVILGHYALRSIAPVATASVVGALIVRFHFGQAPVFGVPEMAAASLWDFPAAALLGVAAAGLAIIFNRGTLHLPALFAGWAERIHMPSWLLPIPGGLVIGLIALMAPEILGVGYEATSNALATEYTFGLLALLLILKTLATIISLACRFAGGVFSPSLYLGAMLGSAFGIALAVLAGDQTAGPGFFAVIGMGAVAGAVLGAPLSTTLIVFELTASYEASVAVLVAVSLATVLSQSTLGGSLFQLQMRRRGYDIAGGASRLVLQMVRVRDVMEPLGSWSEAEIQDGTCVYEDDTLGRAFAVLDAEQIDSAIVRERSDAQAVTGIITKADAQAAYARRLAEISEEEHR
ncbi:chloride channel protein [Maricaulis maris]|uniref:CIC family chloride channel protein n=1 Tax=Maricaulis maris TaxID=74318 RepID=A0A495DD92_9PROT|nr:chloride channel protein [Maricaulis maris]RKR00262.1 CIC family chloride channel protein [Maricaulis maris]